MINRSAGGSRGRASQWGGRAAAGVQLLGANSRLRRASACWGLWVLGDWALFVLLSVTAFDRAGAGAVAALGVVRMLPGAVAGPLLSPLADRVRRARLLGAVLLVWVVTTAAMCGTVDIDSPVPLFLLVGVSSTSGAVLRSTFSGLVPQVIDDPEQLSAANSTYSLVEATGSLLGPLLAALLVASADPPIRYLFAAGVFAAADVIAWTISTEFKPPARLGPVGWRRLREVLSGFAVLALVPRLRVVIGVFMAQSMTRGLVNVLTVALAVRMPGVGVDAAGTFFAAIGAGGVAGGLLGLLGASWRPQLPFVTGMVLWGLPLVLIAAVPHPAVAWVALAAVGFGNALGDAYGLTLLGLLIPDHMLGRAYTALWTGATGFIAAGTALAAPMLSGWGVRTSLLVVGVAMAATAALGWPAIRATRADLAVNEHDLDVLRHCDVLAPMTRVALEQLVRRVRVVAVDAGTVVVAAGDLDQTCYVIDRGSLEAQVRGATVRTMGPGGCFGEIAAVRGTPRTATVIARTPCRLLRFDRSDFVLAVTGHRAADDATAGLVEARMRRVGEAD